MDTTLATVLGTNLAESFDQYTAEGSGRGPHPTTRAAVCWTASASLREVDSLASCCCQISPSTVDHHGDWWWSQTTSRGSKSRSAHTAL